MASIWSATNGDRVSRKIAGHMTRSIAIESLAQIAADWATSGRFRTLKVLGQLEVHLCERRGGKPQVVGHLWIETLSPPSQPAGGDIYRTQGA